MKKAKPATMVPSAFDSGVKAESRVRSEAAFLFLQKVLSAY